MTTCRSDAMPKKFNKIDYSLAKVMGEKIREIREFNHLTQAELAEELGVSQDLVCCWEKGKTYISVIQLRDLVQVMSTIDPFASANWILGLED